MATHRHEIYSRDATVHLVTGESKFDTFRQTVVQAGFVSHLLARWQASGKPKRDFLIAIKPNIMCASTWGPAGWSSAWGQSGPGGIGQRRAFMICRVDVTSYRA